MHNRQESATTAYDSTDKIAALQSLLSCDTLGSEGSDTILCMIRKEKEKQVLNVHKYKISGPFGKKQIYFTTQCKWLDKPKHNAYGKTENDAYNKIIDYLYDHYFGSCGERLTVRDVYDRMMTEYEKTHVLTDLTLVHYRAEWNKYVVGKGAKWLDKPIISVKNSQIFDFYRTITATNEIKISTFRNLKSVINAVFDYAIIHDIPCIKASHISTNKLSFASSSDKWDGVYSSEDRQKILAACEKAKPTVYTKAIELMFCLDIRIGELRALQKGDVDLDNRTVHIAHEMVDRKTDKANRHAVRSDIMKGKKEVGKRVAPLSDRAVRAIKWLNANFGDSIWLLPNRNRHEPIYTNTFNENLKKICGQAGIKYFSSHGLRFHIISAMFDAGIPEKEIQRLSGHTTLKMTQHYNRKIDPTTADSQIRKILG